MNEVGAAKRLRAWRVGQRACLLGMVAVACGTIVLALSRPRTVVGVDAGMARLALNAATMAFAGAQLWCASRVKAWERVVEGKPDLVLEPEQARLAKKASALGWAGASCLATAMALLLATQFFRVPLVTLVKRLGPRGVELLMGGAVLSFVWMVVGVWVVCRMSELQLEAAARTPEQKAAARQVRLWSRAAMGCLLGLFAMLLASVAARKYLLELVGSREALKMGLWCGAGAWFAASAACTWMAARWRRSGGLADAST